ncbi:MAG: hypothetical protein V4584_14915 [Verrucomicrobiota bacterium]
MFSGDYLMAVAFFFERENGNPLGENELAEIKEHGLEFADAEAIARQLQLSLGGNPLSADARASIYWALSKRFDDSLLPFFQESLARELGEDNSPVFQVMIALDNLNQPVFSKGREGSFSVLDDELNRGDAAAYLKEIN